MMWKLLKLQSVLLLALSTIGAAQAAQQRRLMKAAP